MSAKISLSIIVDSNNLTSITFDDSSTLKKVRDYVLEKKTVNLSPNQIFFFAGEPLLDEGKTLKECNFKSGAELDLKLAPEKGPLTRKFLDWCRNNSHVESVKFSDIFRTPLEHKMLVNETSIIKMEECIITNFMYSPTLAEKEMPNCVFEKLAKILELPESEEKIAMLTILIHSSKYPWSQRYMTHCVTSLLELEILDDPCEYSQYVDLKLLQKKSVIDSVEGTAKDVTGMKKVDFFLPKIVWVSCSFPFAGASSLEKMYVNIHQLRVFIAKLSNRIQRDPVIVKKVVKARLYALYVHELTHVIIRSSLKDLNDSSPVLTQKQIREAGQEGESRCFGAIIDWVQIYDHVTPEFFDLFLKSLDDVSLDVLKFKKGVPEIDIDENQVMGFSFEGNVEYGF